MIFISDKLRIEYRYCSFYGGRLGNLRASSLGQKKAYWLYSGSRATSETGL